MSGGRPASTPGDDALREMLEGRASRLGVTDAREVLAAVRTEIEGPAAGAMGDRGGRSFGLQRVRVEPQVRGRGARMPWRLAVVGVAAVVAVAVLGSRLSLGPTNPDAGTSPSTSAVASPVEMLTPVELAAGVEDGSLDGKTVLVLGHLARVQEGACRLSYPPGPDCWRLAFPGMEDLVIDEGDHRYEETGLALAVHGGDEPIALRVTGRAVELLGWVVDGAEGPLVPTAFDAGTTPLDALELAVVRGWLTPAHGDAICVARVGGGCDGSHPRLTDRSPFLDGTWTDGVPGIDVSVPSSFGLDEDGEVMAGQFLVGVHGAQLGGYPPPYSVVATLDAEIERMDLQVTPIDATPAPSTEPVPLTAAQLVAGIADGSLDGRTALVDARLAFDPVPCPTATADCLNLHVEGPVSVPLARVKAVTLEAYGRNVDSGAPFAVRVDGGRATLLGWVVASVDVAWMLAELTGADSALPAGDLVEVRGWLLPDPPEPECIRLMLCDTWPRLTVAMPFVDGVPAYDTPGVNVGVDVTLGLDDPLEFMVGRFLVESLGTPESRLPPYRVVATLDAAVQRVDQQVTPIDATPAPDPTPPHATPTDNPTRPITNDELMTALGNGSLDGRLLVIDTELRTVAWDCPADVPEPCTRFWVDGLPGIALTYDGMVSGSDGSDGGAGVSGMTGTMVVVPRNGHLELLGRLDAALEAPVDFGPVFAGTADPVTDAFEVTPVPGWLIREAVPETCPTPAPTGEPGSSGAGCTPAVDVLSDGPPSDTAAIHYAVNEDGGPGLGGSAAVVEGPFLVRPGPFAGDPCPPESAGCSWIVSYGWEVVARYDPAQILPVVLP